MTRFVAFLVPLVAAGCRQTPSPDPQGPKSAETTPEKGDTAASAEPNPDWLPPQGPHPLGVRDLLAMKRVSGPVLTPDEKGVVVSLSLTDFAKNGRKKELWYVPWSGEPRMILGGGREPAFGPDGTLYYLSKDSGSSQVWQTTVAGGTPKQVTDLPLGVDSLRVSPDGNTLAVTLRVFVDCETLACTAERLEQQEKQPATGKVFDRLFVRHWDTWKDGLRSHLFVLPANGGAPRDVMPGFDGDVPSVPFGGREDYVFSSDSTTLVFAARDAGGGNEEPRSTNFDLYAATVAKKGVRRLTQSPAWDAHPVFSPDGKTLAYLAMERPNYEADRFSIVLMDWSSGDVRKLAPDWDRSVSELVFAPGGRTLFVTAKDTGNVPVFGIDTTSGEVTRRTGAGVVSSLHVSDRLVFLRKDLAHPAELYTLPRAAPKDGRPAVPEQLSDFNKAAVANAVTGKYRPFRFAGAGGDTVNGWIIEPAGRKEGDKKKYPVAFLIHGGPQGSFNNNYSYRWNPQVYAGAGYAVITVDFHGSTGYGQAFTDSIRGDWGGKPLEDLKKGLAHALAKNPWMDGDRVCALGASYGGFMINWIAGQWPDRFKCLVNHSGIFDQRSMYYSTEELWFVEWDMQGPYFENPGSYEKFNPALHVAQWKTPMLVVHGALDFRVPIEQGLSAFTALQRRGIKSRLLVFPDENHWILKPLNSLLWHETVLDWLAQHTAE